MSYKQSGVGVIGLGYVGLTLSLALAQRDVLVRGIEKRASVVNAIRRGEPHFFEEGLEKALKRELQRDYFTVGESPTPDCDTYVLCVGTPLEKTTRAPDLRALEEASSFLGGYLKKRDLVINRTTVPVGTTRNLVIPLIEKTSGLECGKDFDVAYAPERTLAGKAMHELFINPQIIGGHTMQSRERAKVLFSSMTSDIVSVSSLEAAETVKLFDNTHRYAMFGISNELAMLCEEIGVDAYEVINAANYNYPSNRIPLPSPGVGGPCLTKDHYLLLSPFVHNKVAPLIHAARQINEQMPQRMIERIYRTLESFGTHQDPAFFLAGFAFKGEPPTSDMRDSTSLIFLEALKKRTSRIVGYDPVVPFSELASLGISTVHDYREGFRNADCVVLLNNHKSYAEWNLDELVGRMRTPGVIFDAWRKLTLPQDLAKAKIAYLSVGMEPLAGK